MIWLTPEEWPGTGFCVERLTHGLGWRESSQDLKISGDALIGLDLLLLR